MAIIAIFFFWPAAQAIYFSFMLEDPFGFSSTFVGLENYARLFTSSAYLQSALFTLVFSALIAFFSLAIALLLAVKANAVVRGASTYKTLLMWVYAVAPAVAGAMGVFLFDRNFGPLHAFFNQLGGGFNPQTDALDATLMLALVAVWKQVPVNFIFFLSGLQGVPKSVREAAAIDCRSDTRRFWTVVFPLLAPTSFFLLIINITYAFFDTFGIVDTMTSGRPGGATATLVYKVYQDGFLGADLGGSSAQSVVLMIVVLLLTMVQFRLIEKRIHYS
ncbi:MAG: ABC transporter permease subunit [Inquilinaceae bacterium]